MTKEKTAIAEKPVAVERIKPSLYLTEKDLSEVKNWQVGKEYDLILHVKMTSQSEDTDSPYTGKNTKKPIVSGRFDVLSTDAPAGAKAIDESEYTDKKLKVLEQKSKE